MLLRQENKFLNYFNYLFGLVILSMYFNALIYPNMGVDASYFLRVTECIAEGAIPEYNLRILYPPLVFYMLLPIKILVGNAIAYELFLGYMFLVQLINALLIYKISGYYSTNKSIKTFAGLCYLFLSIKLQGEFLFLEPFINLWGLLALWVYLKNESRSWIFIIFSGSLAFLAFLTKQYGLAYAGTIYVLILIRERSSYRLWLVKSVLFTSGLLIGLFLFITFFRIGYGVYYDFFVGGRLGMYGERDISTMILGLSKIIIIGPYLLLLLIPTFFRKRLKQNPDFLAFIVMILLFSAQLFFNQYNHYYITIIPAIIILGVFMFETTSYKNKIWIYTLLALSLLMAEYYIGPRTPNMVFSRQSTLAFQTQSAKNINTIVPEKSKVYLITNVQFYYLCHFEPALPDKYGFSYNNALKLQDLEEILFNADFLIISNKKTNGLHRLIDTAVSVRESIIDQRFIHIAEIDNNSIYRRSPQ